jgi:hypothetical protein
VQRVRHNKTKAARRPKPSRRSLPATDQRLATADAAAGRQEGGHCDGSDTGQAAEPFTDADAAVDEAAFAGAPPPPYGQGPVQCDGSHVAAAATRAVAPDFRAWREASPVVASPVITAVASTATNSMRFMMEPPDVSSFQAATGRSRRNASDGLHR